MMTLPSGAASGARLSVAMPVFDAEATLPEVFGCSATDSGCNQVLVVAQTRWRMSLGPHTGNGSQDILWDRRSGSVYGRQQALRPLCFAT